MNTHSELFQIQFNCVLSERIRPTNEATKAEAWKAAFNSGRLLENAQPLTFPIFSSNYKIWMWRNSTFEHVRFFLNDSPAACDLLDDLWCTAWWLARRCGSIHIINLSLPVSGMFFSSSTALNILELDTVHDWEAGRECKRLGKQRWAVTLPGNNWVCFCLCVCVNVQQQQQQQSKKDAAVLLTWVTVAGWRSRMWKL